VGACRAFEVPRFSVHLVDVVVIASGGSLLLLCHTFNVKQKTLELHQKRAHRVSIGPTTVRGFSGFSSHRQNIEANVVAENVVVIDVVARRDLGRHLGIALRELENQMESNPLKVRSRDICMPFQQVIL
jgi:hypothetical protein